MKRLLLIPAFAFTLSLTSCFNTETCEAGDFGWIRVTNYSDEIYTIYVNGRSTIKIGPGQSYNLGEMDAGSHILEAEAANAQHAWGRVEVLACETTYLDLPG